jgi:murein DD-endopeptidase MepM/ murein hydrolase activator NlpD
MKPLAKLVFLVMVSLFLMLGLLLALSFSAQADTITVTNNSDSGEGSLRWALLSANISDTITFDLTAFPLSNPVTIALLSSLPKIITDGLTIDASGAGVILDGHILTEAETKTHGLRIDANNVTISNLRIVNFGWSGIRVMSGSQNTTIKGNTIGGNHNHGIRVQGSDITGTRILNNFLGTDASGVTANGNTLSGISIETGSSNALIQGNVIAANDDHGITISGTATSNIIISNNIGTEASGSLNLGNKLHGIIIRGGAQGNIIGPGNVIAYNGWDGVCVTGTNTLSNKITRNSITANDGLGIDNVNGGNNALEPPRIIAITGTAIRGQAQPGATIEIFTDSFFEGQRFLVSTIADMSGTFTATLTTSLTVPLVTATSTDAAGNTSEFGAFCRLQDMWPEKIWPYCTTEPTPISSPFGPRLMASQGFRYDFHRGVDLPAPLETPFFAIADGVVSEVDPDSPDGTIQIKHTDPVTYYSRYRHVFQALVSIGQVVTRGGMPIGLTGESKLSKFDHIHFEIRDDETGTYEKYSVNPFGRMPYNDTNDYEIEISQVSVDPTDPAGPTTVLLMVTGPRQELDLNRFTLSIDGSERVLDFNHLNWTQTPAPNNTDPDVLDNPYQDDICIMPARFNTSSDVYRLNLAFHKMPGNPPYTVIAQAADLFSNTVTAKTKLVSSELLLTPAVVTATTPTGRWVTHTHTLTNASPITQVYALTARSAQSWTVAIEPVTVTLASGESVTFTTSISVPDNGYVVPGTMDCVVVEATVRKVYLPLILKKCCSP